jgi:hypothetical protein
MDRRILGVGYTSKRTFQETPRRSAACVNRFMLANDRSNNEPNNNSANATKQIAREQQIAQRELI